MIRGFLMKNFRFLYTGLQFFPNTIFNFYYVIYLLYTEFFVICLVKFIETIVYYIELIENAVCIFNWHTNDDFLYHFFTKI